MMDSDNVAAARPLHIAISSIGRFHMFDQTRQMVRLGQDVRLYTGYPRFKIDKDLRSVSQTRSLWVLAEYLRRRVAPPPRTTWWSDHLLEDFGPWLARNLGDVDILDAVAATGWEAGRVLHDRGKPWICNRGSTHILAQKELLDEEHASWRVSPPLFGLGRTLERLWGGLVEAEAIVDATVS